MRCACVLFLLSVFALVGQIHAETVYDYSHPFSDGIVTKPTPEGIAPWVRAAFTSTGTANARLRMEVLHLSDDEFVSNFYFNFDFDPDLNPLLLSLVHHDGLETATAPTVEKDTYKADGDGRYDILFSFPTAKKGRFGDECFSEYDITYNGSLPAGTDLADRFYSLSMPEGGNGPYHTAIHVQGLSGGQSTHLYGTVPEPGGLIACLGLALSGMIARPRRRRDVR